MLNVHKCINSVTLWQISQEKILYAALTEKLRDED